MATKKITEPRGYCTTWYVRSAWPDETYAYFLHDDQREVWNNTNHWLRMACEHKHRTPEAAERCRVKKYGKDSDRGFVVTACDFGDGSRVSGHVFHG